MVHNDIINDAFCTMLTVSFLPGPLFPILEKENLGKYCMIMRSHTVNLCKIELAIVMLLLRIF